MDVEITNALRGIQHNLAKPVQVAPPPDPNGPLWDMLKKITLPPDDRLAVGMHLQARISSPSQLPYQYGSRIP
jgi:hypothetical protein